MLVMEKNEGRHPRGTTYICRRPYTLPVAGGRSPYLPLLLELRKLRLFR